MGLPNSVPKPKRRPAAPKVFSSIKPKTRAEKLAMLWAQLRTPVRKKPRPKKETLRIYGPVARRKWMKSLPCLVRGYCEGEIQGHHIKTGGKGRKADARFIVPMCAKHHAALHLIGRQSFESFYNIHLETAAAYTELAWREYSGSND